MKSINNRTDLLRDDMQETIKRGDRLSIAAACFSMYAYSELKKQLDGISELRFIFTSPTFVKERAQKQRREFYIPQLNRENSLYGTEFELKLKNELTQRAIARECAEWIRKKVTFKSNVTDMNVPGFITVESKENQSAYYPIQGFTTVDLGCERGNNMFCMINRFDAPLSSDYINSFNSLWNDKDRLQDVTDVVLDNITTAYNENAPEFIYFMMLYNIFGEFLEDISEDYLPNEATGFKNSKIWEMLYDFQRDAALAIISKLEKYNGCILADSVGLGKTFTALAVIKYYECRNMRVLVLCPKRLEDNWNTFKANYRNNPIKDDRLRYDVLFHTDLSRSSGKSNGQDLELLDWGNFDLVVIDESHNFRNGAGTHFATQENRYMRLMDKVIRAGVKTKVLMLSATPVNNKFKDLQCQLALAYEGNPELLDEKLNTNKPVEDIFRQAQRAFNDWSDLPYAERTTDALLRRLDFDFFELLDSVTIARSRKHIEKYYNSEQIGKFPVREQPHSLRPSLTDLKEAASYNDIYEMLMSLSLSIYTPSNFIFESKADKYLSLSGNKGNMTQRGREFGIRKLMSINLLKRLESSVYAFRLTLKRIYDFINDTVAAINDYEANGKSTIKSYEVSEDDLDIEDSNIDFFSVGKSLQIDLADMDYVSWRRELLHDSEILASLIDMMNLITPEHDSKLKQLYFVIDYKQTHPLNPGNKKLLIFSAFADTAQYLYDNVSKYVKNKYNIETAVVTGSADSKSTVKGLKANMNNILSCFSPVSKNRSLLNPENQADIDILIATDCISEGQNLQDCDYLVNYDIHWNPVRIIQRFGRIDRIGSKNARIQLVNFWPDIELDEYINLKTRVETRMKISVMTSTGDDNPINPDESGDLEYRRQQLKRLQEEVVDIEEMQSGISIMDLGLNEFRLDLLDYIKKHGDLKSKPKGMHAVVPSDDGNPPGVIFVLKNINDSINIDNRNRIHPFYMVYVSDDGEIVCDYLNPKKLLDTARLLCKGRSEPCITLCREFNNLTDDGRDMHVVSKLLTDAVHSVIQVKEGSDIDSLFRAGGTSALLSKISGLDDFELVCFFVVR